VSDDGDDRKMSVVEAIGHFADNWVAGSPVRPSEYQLRRWHDTVAVLVEAAQRAYAVTNDDALGEALRPFIEKNDEGMW
jgi:hypothetical protein